ncbi:MAG: hypothetical protein VZR23_10995 [Lachnospiraceae bacterium]|nr:hypothetical protein [Lachnospiraceae bacterium]
MKNQYIGDVGDYGKYSLLREVANAGVRVGVNWYLTEDDGSNDGKHTSYLKNDKLRRYSPEVFDTLSQVAFKADKSVLDIQHRDIIPGAIFYSDILKPEGNPKSREQIREKWFNRSVSELKEAELVFLDPDNGLLEGNDPSKLGAEKYALPDEVERYFNEGHNVVYYCHKGRRTYDLWMSYKSLMFERIHGAKPTILTFHKGTQRSYVFLIHQEDYIRYRKIIDRFTYIWPPIFSEEFTSLGDVSREKVGEAFTLEKTDGTIVTIQMCADGRIQMKSSKEKNMSHIVKVDYFCKCLGL